MVPCVTEHTADRSDVDACGVRYFCCLHPRLGKHAPKTRFGASECVGSTADGFRQFAFFQRMSVVLRSSRLFVADGKRCMGSPLLPSPHVDALVLGNLYGQTVRLEFYRFLRPEQKFPDLEALRRQVELDRANALEVLK